VSVWRSCASEKPASTERCNHSNASSGRPARAHEHAALNATSALFLGLGYWFIRHKRVAAHRACMLAAFCVSALFLLSYVVYHALAGSRPFAGQGWARAVYFPLLISHVVLAAAMVPFVLTTLYRALGGQFERHARLARRTLPVWLYVSVTGVLVYWMLYRLFP